MDHLAVTKERVKQILIEQTGNADEDSDGDIGYRNGSTVAFVRVSSWFDEHTVVFVFSHVANNVPPSPELYEFVARRSNTFVMGHLGCTDLDDGTVRVHFGHTLLGDYIDPPELMDALNGVLNSADELDDEIVSRFGGTTFLGD